MTIFRFTASFSIFVFLSLFVQANLFQEDFTSGTFGLSYLYAAILSFMVVVVSSGDIASFFKVKKSIFVLILFLGYTLTKYYFEANEFQFKQVAIGSTQGLLFYLAAGLIASYALSTIYNLQRTAQLSRLITIATVAYFLYLLFSLYFFVIQGLSITRPDELRVDEITYQRPADLLILQLIIATSLAFVVVIERGKRRFTKYWVLLLCVGIIAVLTAIVSQIMGSNKGLLASAGVLILYLTCSFTALFSSGHHSIKVSNIIFGRTSFYLMAGLTFASIIVICATLIALNYFQIDYTQTRILGYGYETDGIRSVTSRSDIFKQNFYRHFEYSPIFGHTQVHTLVDGHHGLYVHSTLSILTHLGIVGFLLFVLLIASIYLEITRGNSGNRLDVLPNNAMYSLFRLSVLAFVLAMGIYSAFFTWMPLWFSIGFFGTWFGFRASDISVRAKSHRRRLSDNPLRKRTKKKTNTRVKPTHFIS